MNRNKFPVSIASYSFHGLLAAGETNVFTYLEDLKFRYDVRFADIWSGFLPNLDGDFIKKIRASMDEKGITLANLCVDGPHLWVDDDIQRENHYKKALDYIEAAKILGARTIRIDMGSMEEDVPDEKLDYIIKTYREYAELCAPEGIRIGTENHWGSSRYPKNLEKLYSGVNHKNYGHLFHFGNFAEGLIDEGLETVLKMAIHTHVPANSIPFAKEYLRRLINADYAGTFSIEHHSSKNEYLRVEWQLATVRGLLGELEAEGYDKPAVSDFYSDVYKGNIK